MDLAWPVSEEFVATVNHEVYGYLLGWPRKPTPGPALVQTPVLHSPAQEEMLRSQPWP